MPTVSRPLAVALAPTLALALATGARPAAAQNLVQNGGFESPFIVGNATLSGCPPGFVWCIGQGNIDLVQSDWVPREGRQSIDLNGTTAGSIFQSLATTPGRSYELSFRFSGNPDGDPVKTMRILWGSRDLGAFEWVVGPLQSRQNMLWSRIRIGNLVATSATTRLEFRSTTTSPCDPSGAPSCGPALDAIDVAAIDGGGGVGVVPEPGTLALLGGGLVVLGAAARRRG